MSFFKSCESFYASIMYDETRIRFFRSAKLDGKHTHTHIRTHFPIYLLYFLYGFHSQEDTSHPPGNARVKGTRETESKAIIFLFFLFGKG